MQSLIYDNRILAKRGFYCIIQNFTEVFGVLSILAVLYKIFVTVQSQAN